MLLLLYASPLAKGLFEKAISQSGGTTVTSIKDAENINRTDNNLKGNYKYRHLTTDEWINVLNKKGLISSKFDDKNILTDLRSLSAPRPNECYSKGRFLERTKRFGKDNR